MKIPVSCIGIKIISSSYVNIKRGVLLLQIQGREYSSTIQIVLSNIGQVQKTMVFLVELYYPLSLLLPSIIPKWYKKKIQKT